MGAGWYPPDHPKHVRGLAFNGHADRNLRSTKNDGDSWFNIAHTTTSGHGQNPDGRKQKGSGPIWFDTGIAALSSKSSSRKAASAHIAKIPIALSRHIARAWKPESVIGRAASPPHEGTPDAQS